MTAARHASVASAEPVTVTNRGGRGRVVIACDHASNRLPAGYGTLGLPVEQLGRHIAWDPGAAPVARILSSLLDAPLVESGISRLLIDCNRAEDAPDLIAEVSEATRIPGNAGLDAVERQRRLALAHLPFHAAIDGAIAERLAADREVWLISVHSFTPIYKGVARPWPIGIVHDEDERLAGPLIQALETRQPRLKIGRNQPYSPTDGVYYTLERHARRRGLPCAMIEIRNDEVADAVGQRRWGEMLAEIVSGLELAAPASAADRAPASTGRVAQPDHV